MINSLVATLFERLADMLDLRGDEPFKGLSYRRAATYIHKMSEPLEALDRDGRLLQLPGIGKAMAAKIHDIIETGTMRQLEELEKEVPPELLLLLSIPGVGPKTARRLYLEAGVTGTASLDAALNDGRVKALKGFGEKKADAIRMGLNELASRERRFPQSYAMPLATMVLESLAAGTPVMRAAVVGSLRRRKETVGDIDLLASAAESDIFSVLSFFTARDYVASVSELDAGTCKALLKAGVECNLTVVKDSSYAIALQQLTGSSSHNEQLSDEARRLGVKLDRNDAIFDDEPDIYRALGLEFIPPELRENSGELAAAREHRLPMLVSMADIRGDLHSHTVSTDGIDSIEAMALAARDMGYEYIAITDHSKALAFAHGLDEERLFKQGEMIDRLSSQISGITVLKGVEVDILADGRADLSDEALAACDFVVGSIHSGFQGDRDTVQRRLEAAMKNPHIDVIGHPTGRILERRQPYRVDPSWLIDMAKVTGTALEVNSSPDRLDLSSEHVRMAKGSGVKCVISTDAHSRRGLLDISYGVDVARRGWLEKADVLNTMSLGDLKSWLRDR